MASKSEALSIGTKVRRDRGLPVKAFAVRMRRWALNGQLGGLPTTELGRHTGGRC